MIAAGPSLTVAAGRREFWLLWLVGEEVVLPVRAYRDLWRAIEAARVVHRWAARYGTSVDEFLMRYFESKKNLVPHGNKKQIFNGNLLYQVS